MNRIYCTGDLHGEPIERFSFRQHPGLRRLDETDVMVCLGDIGIGWGLPQTIREWRYKLQWMANQKYTYLLVRGNHDNTDWWLSCPPTAGNEKVRLIDGDLRQAALEDKIFDNIYLVYSSALLDVCGKKCLAIGGAKSHDAHHLAWPHEKERIKRLKREHQFYRVIGKSWWSDENINIPYAFSLLNDYFRTTGTYHAYVENLPFVDDGKKRVGYFDYIFTHDCPAFMCDVYARPGGLGRLRPTENEDFLELIKDHINYRYFIHGHMHTFMRYAVNEDDYGKHEVVCLYKDIFKLPDNPRDSNFQDWEFIC